MRWRLPIPTKDQNRLRSQRAHAQTYGPGRQDSPYRREPASPEPHPESHRDAENGQQHPGIGQIAQRKGRAVPVDDDSGILKADDGDEQAYPGGYGHLHPHL